MLRLSNHIQIPLSEILFSYSRSGGPGGQNVNKVNSKVTLRFSIEDSPSLRDQDKLWLLDKLSSQLNVSGELVVTSDRHGEQIRNREDALEKMKNILIKALERPKPRKKTKPSFSSEVKRREKKKKHSDKKTGRRWSPDKD